MHAPSFKQLQFLIALAEYRHFGRAAHSCHISQAAFSLAIKELESRLGLTLVERGNRNVMLTAEGQKVVELARRCQADMEAILQFSQAHQSPFTGRLQLGVIPTIAPFMLPDVLHVLGRKLPDLEVYLREEKSETLVECLLDGQLDMILLALPYPMRHVTVCTLFQDRFYLAARRHSKWFPGGSSEPVDPAGLPPESILLLDDGHCLRDHALEGCRFSDLTRISRYSATSLTTLLHMVVTDIGVTFVPEMAIPSIRSMFREIELYPLTDQPARSIGLVWRANSHRSQDFFTLAEMLKPVSNHSSLSATPS